MIPWGYPHGLFGGESADPLSIPLSRKVSGSLPTNTQVVTDSHIGGDLEIAGRWQLPLVAGDVIIMPGWVSHRVLPVTDGIRISFAAWATGKRYR